MQQLVTSSTTAVLRASIGPCRELLPRPRFARLSHTRRAADVEHSSTACVAGKMYARAVLTALALGLSAATDCNSYPCDCADNVGDCIAVGSEGTGGLHHKGGRRPNLSWQACKDLPDLHKPSGLKKFDFCCPDLGYAGIPQDVAEQWQKNWGCDPCEDVSFWGCLIYKDVPGIGSSASFDIMPCGQCQLQLIKADVKYVHCCPTRPGATPPAWPPIQG